MTFLDRLLGELSTASDTRGCRGLWTASRTALPSNAQAVVGPRLYRRANAARALVTHVQIYLARRGTSKESETRRFVPDASPTQAQGRGFAPLQFLLHQRLSTNGALNEFRGACGSISKIVAPINISCQGSNVKLQALQAPWNTQKSDAI